MCFGVWGPDDCVIRKNICQIHVSSPLQFPPHSYTSQLVRVREGSHTLHLLHPEAAPLMGVPSIVVLRLVHNLQEWLESLFTREETFTDQTGRKIPFVFVCQESLTLSRTSSFSFVSFSSHAFLILFVPFCFSLFVHCRLLGCPVKRSRHAWIQASGVRLWRRGQVRSGEYPDSPDPLPASLCLSLLCSVFPKASQITVSEMATKCFTSFETKVGRKKRWGKLERMIFFYPTGNHKRTDESVLFLVFYLRFLTSVQAYCRLGQFYAVLI